MLLHLLKTYLAPYKGAIAIVVALQLLGAITSLYLPSLNADIIDHGIVIGDQDYIVRIGALMLGFALVQALSATAAVFLGARTAMRFGRDLRGEIFRRVGEFSSREVASFGAPSLITRNTNDVQQVQALALMSLTLMVMAPIMMVGGIVMAVREDFGLSWLVLVAVPVLAGTVSLMIARLIPAYRAMQARIDDLNRVLREQATGIRVLRAFGREPLEAARFSAASSELADIAITAGRWVAAMSPVLMLSLNAASVAVVWFGGIRVDAGTMQIGSLTAYLTYLALILMSVMMATFTVLAMPRALVGADRIGAILNTEPSVVRPTAGVEVVERRGQLELRNVDFSYPGAHQPVLCDITFAAQRGQTTGIIGATGSGKTTLLGLVPRLFDVTRGHLLVDGVDARDLDPDFLCSRIGFVPQNPYLFSGTVASNLRYGNPSASDEELWAALEVAQAQDFVAAMPGGLAARIAQGGINVSGGQRQRLCIARALVRKPEIYLFDDCFSALDLATDARLRHALKPLTRDATVVLVAQRVSTIKEADQIVVLEGGCVAGLGTHASLLKKCSTYREIVESQKMSEVGG
jgi:ATP-binding cassette subfamily B protein